jgi:16S rRNA (uracil1498-N3)-methyltransferase
MTAVRPNIMPAETASPPKSTPRLFIDEELHAGRAVHLAGPSAHYLINVMRLTTGSPIKLFDDRSGEYLAVVSGLGKRDLTLTIERQLRPREPMPDLWLCQAMIKKDRLDWVTEKSCELGIARFVPILTSRCVADKLKEGRIRAQMIDVLLRDWPAGRTLYFCDERGGAPFGGAIKSGPAAVMIGPEGGFTDQENEAIRAHPDAVAISLGPRILRAETAAVTAISVWMAANGDWG